MQGRRQGWGGCSGASIWRNAISISCWKLNELFQRVAFSAACLSLCVVRRVRAREVAATESLSPPHTPASLQDGAHPPQPTHRTSHVSCLTIKGRSSPSCWFLFPCMGSSPSVELVWLGFNSPPLSPCISLRFQSEKILQETCDSQRRDNYAAQKRLPSVRMDW